MKIALLMYGLIRNIEQTNQRFDILRNNFLKGIDIDIYCVTNDIAGNHIKNREIDIHSKILDESLNTFIKKVSPKEYSIIKFEDELRDTSKLVSILSSIYTLPEQPIQNTVSKWYKMQKALSLCKDINYDTIMCCRMDCQFIPKFSQSQLLSSSGMYLLGPLWAGIASYGKNYLRSEAEAIKMATSYGYPEDFFYGPMSDIMEFSNMLSFMETMSSKLPNFHPEIIYNAFLKFKNMKINMIKWSENITKEDFNSVNENIINVGCTYPPEMTIEFLANRL
jgi:hypothetical protein